MGIPLKVFVVVCTHQKTFDRGWTSFLKLVARGFLRERRFPSLLHRPVNKAKINAISTMSNFIEELSLHTTWFVSQHAAHDKALNVLHVIWTRLHPGHLSVRVGECSLRSEEIVKKSPIASFNVIIIIIIIIVIILLLVVLFSLFLPQYPPFCSHSATKFACLLVGWLTLI